ncbi:hypothetical protein NEIG_01854 [Nematocida sp. ERTm5]|nr:hypothetical protein NEIG_01854 [Nematocida sp. ERTm5]
MVSYIDENELRTKVQKKIQEEFKDKEGKMKLEDRDKIYKIIADINREERIFRNIPSIIENLAYNILYIQIYNRIIYKDTYYNEGSIISEIIDSVKNIDVFIDIIINITEELTSDDKKLAFYNLIGNNHRIMACVYKLRSDSLNHSINILCKNKNILELDEEITSEDAMVKLCGLTDSGNSSRLQRALDILMKHSDNLTITDNNEVEQSNASNLGLTDDDIYSLYLLTRTSKYDSFKFMEFLKDSIYNSICIKSNRHIRYLICNLYDIVHSTLINTTNTNLYIKDILYATREDLKNMRNNEVMYVNNEIIRSDIFNDIIKTESDLDNFKNNVINNYLKSIESDVLSIKFMSIKKKVKITLSVIAIFMIIYIIILSIVIILHPDEVKKIMID